MRIMVKTLEKAKNKQIVKIVSEGLFRCISMVNIRRHISDYLRLYCRAIVKQN